MAEAQLLANDLIAMPSVPVAITKEHVNAVTRVLGAGSTAFGDGDALLSTIGEEESREAARRSNGGDRPQRRRLHLLRIAAGGSKSEL